MSWKETLKSLTLRLRSGDAMAFFDAQDAILRAGERLDELEEEMRIRETEERAYSGQMDLYMDQLEKAWLEAEPPF
jgi:hypothetical protein